MREEATGNLCLGTRALVRERVSGFLASLSKRKEEVKRRCRTVLQSKAREHLRNSQSASQYHTNAHPTLALVYVVAVIGELPGGNHAVFLLGVDQGD